MKIDVNKIITLGNKEKYLVISHIVHNNKNYYYIAQLDENEKDIKDNYKIMELVNEGEKELLNEVIGETNLKTVLPLFVSDIVK